MKIIFKIEFKYENSYILGRLLSSKEDLELKTNSKLEVFKIKNIVPSDAMTLRNNDRNDLFIFSLKEISDFKNLNTGKIIELI